MSIQVKPRIKVKYLNSILKLKKEILSQFLSDDEESTLLNILSLFIYFLQINSVVLGTNKLYFTKLFPL